MKRGRKSIQERLTVVEGAFGNRPEPPGDLTERQQEIWREVVASEPATFFNTAALRGLLADYCRHRESSEGISTIIGQFKPEWLKSADGAKRYQSLLRMRELETRVAANLAGKLRLTNQSRYRPDTAATSARNMIQAPKPWES
jgi:hypothetical protein